MNHLTTEPTESKSGDGSYAAGALATAEKRAASTEKVETTATGQPNRLRQTAVPPLDPTAGIELRVTRAGMPARRLRINAMHCTFGSGDGCTVRLSDASLRPLHAVIQRENSRILIRGYSVPLEINGNLMAESLLSLGDVIRLGQYCFEMIDLPITDGAEDPYIDEVVGTSDRLSRHGEPARAKHPGASQPRHQDHPVATDDSRSNEPSSNQKRLKFSQPTATPRPSSLRRSGSQAVLDGLQVSQDGVQIMGHDDRERGDETFVDEPTVREPVTSLAQIHVQAKRNLELMAELAAANRREQQTNEQLDATAGKLKATQAEVVLATKTAAALKTEIASLNNQVVKLADETQQKQSVAAAEHAKLNRTIVSLRESGEASQKAEAATRQALQESIRQRDEAFAQRALAIDAQKLTQTKLEEAEAQIRRLNQEAEETSNLLSRFESEAEASRVRIDELKDVCCSQADQISKLSTSLEASQSSELAAVMRLKNNIDQLQIELDASRQRVKSADLERVQLNTLQTTLDSTLQEHIAEKMSWGADVNRLNRKMETLAVELQSTEDELNRSREESATLQTQICELRSQIAGVETELSARPTIEQLQGLQSQLVQSESDLENTERQLTQLREDYDELASQRVAQQASPIAPQAVATSLPSSLFPVPELPTAAAVEELPIEATHATNTQEIVELASSGGAALSTAESSPLMNSRVSESDVSTDDTGVQSHWRRSTLEPQPTLNHDKATMSESSWNAPRSVASNTSQNSRNKTNSNDADAESLNRYASGGAPSNEPETQSHWRTSNRPHTEVMIAESGEEAFHTQPMNRSPGGMFSPVDEDHARAEFSPASSLDAAEHAPHTIQPASGRATSIAENRIEEGTISNQPVEDESDIEQENALAALLKRSEGSDSNWFADYTSSQRTNVETTDSQEPEDEHAVLERFSQHVDEYDTTESEIENAIAESQHNGLEPEASALSLARMLINELDAADQEDRGSKLDSSEVDLSEPESMPESMPEPKRSIAALITEESVGIPSVQEDQTPQVEMRRKGFDERAFRESFTDSLDEDMVDPNADEASSLIQSESDHSPTNGAGLASQVVAEEEEEDSVEAYMNQLLRRMGQEPVATPKPAGEPVKPATASKGETLSPVDTPNVTPEVVRPKRPAPELDAPMDQMRELANQSAASAISTSDRKGAKELRSKAITDGAQAGVVVICSLVFFYCGMTSSNLTLVWNTAGTLAIALSAFFFYEMFRKLVVAMKTA